MNLSEIPITHQAEIPEDYLDAMGHMNVMWYTHLFSCGTGGFFKLIGLDMDYMHTNQAGSFALESHVRYLSEVRVGHNVKIRTRIIGRTAKRFHVLHFMTNETKGDLAATMEKVGAHVDMKNRRMSPMPEQITGPLDSIIQQHQALAWDPPLCGVMHA